MGTQVDIDTCLDVKCNNVEYLQLWRRGFFLYVKPRLTEQERDDRCLFKAFSLILSKDLIEKGQHASLLV